jgi:hypothetical protein
LRVSVDVDNSELVALSCYYNMRYRYAQEPEIRQTSDGGYHFIARNLPLDWQEALNERVLFRDDCNRVDLDSMCIGKPAQLLFYKKRGPRTGWRETWKVDARTLLAPPFWVSRRVRKS